MAWDINHVMLVGRLTRDPELKYSGQGMAVCKIGIAVNKNKDQPDYFDVTIFNKLAEICNQYLAKGKQIAVEGRLVQNRWEYEGQKRTKVEIIANNIQFLSPQGQGGQQSPSQGSANNAGSASNANNASDSGSINQNPSGASGQGWGQSNSYGGDFSSSLEDDDIPF
jgi:single-strand DNA-binding protein